MQFRFIASLIVFLGSYFPLSLILLAQDYRYELAIAPFCWPIDAAKCVFPFKNGTLPLILFGVCLACLLLSLLGLTTIKPKVPVDIQEVKYVPSEFMAYTLPYVVSFMSLEYQDTGKLVGLVIFLGWMFVITHRSGQLVLNPLLIVFGWRLYEVTYFYPGNDQTRTGWALSKDNIEPNTRTDVATVQDTMIIKARTIKVSG
ncbi:hypothetical protein ASG19_08945 [Rhizobium sp. Leaf306]|uniref:hypothetical protein n=1 Tax=Rhizobium sp. Leaf306 TaxID=1736330 RepID=UPI000715BA56|nr:hypothetical protein [Rhizobium sp. Leaf306]KQQ36540.1 hypothetical protein ASG19_08945 [Rhizobium sp. Leaf306]